MNIKYSELKFRHIQALRGLAVIIVFLFHLDLEFFKYGYLGVDIFFVISGFVVAKSFFYIQESNTFYLSLLIFYKKRLLRIYPNLLIFSFVVFLSWLLFGQPNISIFESFISSIFFTTNIQGMIGNNSLKEAGYFETIFNNPFHHTWSLAVEFQIYLLIPFILWFYLSTKEKFSKLIFLSIIILISLAAYIIVDNFNKNLSFYFSLLRLWEFLIGVLCFHFFNIDNINIKKKYSFILIILIVFFLVPFEIKFNILAVLFSFLFILKFKELNSFSILPKIGDYSYSIYLYHLPIIYFCNFYFYNYLKYFYILILTTIFSLISYKTVEKFNFTKRSFYSLLILFVSVISILFYLKSNNSNIRQNLKIFFQENNYLNKKYDWEKRLKWDVRIRENKVFLKCNQKIDGLIVKECLVEKNLKDNNFYFIEGDSHTVQFLYVLTKLETLNNYYFTHYDPGQIMFSRKSINHFIKKYKNINYITSISDFTQLESIKKQIANNTDISFILFNSTPVTSPKYPIKCFITQTDCFIEYNDFKLKKITDDINKLNKNFDNVFFFNTSKALCPDDKCFIYDKKNDLIVYRDQSHLTKEGANLLLNKLNNFIKNNFKKN